MNYQLPPDVTEAIQRYVERGEYSSPADVLRDALQALDERISVDLVDPIVVEGIRRGLADMKAGHFIRLEDFDAEFRARHGLPSNG